MEIQKLMSFDVLYKKFDEYRTYVLTALVIIGGLIGAGIYLYFSNIKYEESAQQALSEMLIEYNRAYESPELWSDVEIGARTGYRQYGRSSLAPYFLVLQADASLYQHKDNEALVLMNTAIQKMPGQSPLYYLYNIKFARMQLAHEKTKDEGLSLLESLAKNIKNPQQDQAKYYLAKYYDEHEQLQKAQELWQELVKSKSEQKDVISPWILLAERQINQG
ncbi:MAG: hypothetical protein WDZ41_04520 [Candidatus Babeliales bacterium]